MKNPITEKHAQLITKLQDFQFVIKYIKGKDNVLADFASRPPSNELATCDELRKELNENAINAIVRMELETLIREHGDEEFIETDFRINKKKLERKDGVF